VGSNAIDLIDARFGAEVKNRGKFVASLVGGFPIMVSQVTPLSLVRNQQKGRYDHGNHEERMMSRNKHNHFLPDVDTLCWISSYSQLA
jgi:hypothetical protein